MLRIPSHGRAAAIALAVLLTITSVKPAAAGSQGTLNFAFGGKALDEAQWGDLHRPPEVVLDIAWGDDRWPVLINAYFANSFSSVDSSGFTLEGGVSEFGIGVRKVWDVGSLHPYAAGGAVFAQGDMDGRPTVAVDHVEGGGGLWLGAGAYLRVLERINLGAAFRFTSVTGEIDRVDTKLGGASLGVILGWSWPAAR
jgi:hypothetical protein